MRELDLEPPLGGRRALAENLEDQPGAVDDLGPDLVLEVLLLDRRQRRIDDQQAGLMLLCKRGDLFDLALAEQGRGPDRAQPERALGGDHHADRLGQPFGLLDPRFDRAPRPPRRGSCGTTITARSPRATSIAPLPSNLFRRRFLWFLGPPARARD